jgi:hypothetical protein
MKTDTRYIFTIFTGVAGVWTIKYLYFNLVNRKELDLVLSDYVIIGSLSGLFTSYLLFGFNFRYQTIISITGLVYGVFYNKMMKYYTGRRRSRAERIGIKL